MRPLSRRALFALPVALPVAAVAAKVGVAAPMPAVIIGVDAGGRDRSVVWMATGMRRGKSHYWQTVLDGWAADTPRPVTAQAAAPVGERSCGDVESRRHVSRDGTDRPEGQQQRPAEVAPGPHETIAQPVVA